MALLSLTTSTDAEILQELGRRLAQLRESQRMTAVQVAAGTGLSRRTVHRAELGQNPTLLTLLRLLRLYGRLDALDGFIPAPEVSPMALLEQQRKKRRG